MVNRTSTFTFFLGLMMFVLSGAVVAHASEISGSLSTGGNSSGQGSHEITGHLSVDVTGGTSGGNTLTANVTGGVSPGSSVSSGGGSSFSSGGSSGGNFFPFDLTGLQPALSSNTFPGLPFTGGSVSGDSSGANFDGTSEVVADSSLTPIGGSDLAAAAVNASGGLGTGTLIIMIIVGIALLSSLGYAMSRSMREE